MAGRTGARAWWVFLPLVDLVLLIVLGHFIGTGWAAILWLAGVIVGIAVIRFGARRAWSALREARRTETPPGAKAAYGAGLLAAGVLLALPGPLTDLLGLALLVPFVRKRVGHALAARVAARAVRRGRAPGAAAPPLRVQARRGPTAGDSGPVIDGEASH